uniref:Proliferating cell nuclear antigen PCNA N-terminal domain-containing protein n=1 Tax=viral metagenome TaxID=1070528 RepID=A0A6C0BUG5_9ZZZZ
MVADVVNQENDNFIINIKTVQSGAFRILIEALKEILTDTNIIFDETGIKLIATDNSKIVLIHMKLHSENFEHYYCKKKFKIGVNMNNLFKLIKVMSNNDILNLYIEKNDENRLGIKIYNEDKNTQTIFKLNLLDISEEEISIPPAEFDTELTLPSIDFQKLIRDMTNIGEYVDIKSVGNNLILDCKGDFAVQETTLSQIDDNSENGLKFSISANPEKPIQGIFSLKYLVLFTKCTNLCNLIHMYIRNDYPLIIKYSVANLGEIKLCLSPNVD